MSKISPLVEILDTYLLKHLVDVAKSSSVKVAVAVALEAVREGTRCHFKYHIFDFGKFVLDHGVIAVDG